MNPWEILTGMSFVSMWLIAVIVLAWLAVVLWLVFRRNVTTLGSLALLPPVPKTLLVLLALITALVILVDVGQRRAYANSPYFRTLDDRTEATTPPASCYRVVHVFKCVRTESRAEDAALWLYYVSDQVPVAYRIEGPSSLRDLTTTRTKNPDGLIRIESDRVRVLDSGDREIRIFPYSVDKEEPRVRMTADYTLEVALFFSRYPARLACKLLHPGVDGEINLRVKLPQFRPDPSFDCSTILGEAPN